MFRISFFLVFFLSSILALAQSGRQNRALYDLDGGRYQNKGWHFAPGLTYMFPADFSREETRLSTINEFSDTLYSGTFEASGKFRLYLEFGRHHFYDKFFFLDYLDYGLGFKMLGGQEDFNGIMNVDTAFVNVANTGLFKESSVTGFINFNNILQLSDYTFIQNSFGLNADYRVISKREYNGPTVGMIQEFPPDFMFQLHYKIGFGYKAESGLFIIPSIETPLLNIVKFDDGKSTMKFFSTRYRPIILTLRFLMFSKKKTEDCVGAPKEKTGDQLWDKKMRKKYRR